MASPASSSAEPAPAVGFAFLDARLRAHVERAAAGDPNPGDPLRGLYISDDQALALAADAKADDADARLADAGARLGLDALDTAVLGLCAAPELHPRYGRLFAYLHDDVTRRLASPRLVAELLVGDGVAASDVLACFGHAAALRRTGALRLIEGEGNTTPLGDRAVKVADRARRLPARARRAARPAQQRPPAAPGGAGREPGPRGVDGRDRRLPRRPDAPAARRRRARRRGAVARAAGRPLLLTDVRELSKPEVMADAALCCALEGRLLCGDGLERLEPAERTRAAARARRAPGAARPARAHALRRAHARRPHRAAGRGADADLRRAPGRVVGADRRRATRATSARSSGSR